jgi:glutamate synthase domain-containing protein 2/glutamate synthase domain-containing protein 1/glutamate synthase domain-containing protein 3
MNTGRQGLYDSAYEHDACGVGFVVNINGKKDHQIIDEGIQILCNLEHRGAVGGDLKTGDGAGMLLQLPDQFFRNNLDFALPQEGNYGVGVLFLPRDDGHLQRAKSMVADIIIREGGNCLGWRDVPVDPQCLGDVARESLPKISQVFVSFDDLKDSHFDRKLFIIRKCLENEAKRVGWDAGNFYIPSFSRRTIIYKGMFVASQFACFYPDLVDKNFKSAIALVHQRYSTNTFPSWSLAQPFRYIAHNGEINTLRGNVNKMIALDYTFSSPLFGDEIKKISPVMDPRASDSAIFDNVFELLTMAGRSMEHSMMMMVPEAFGFQYHISQDKRAFYEYHMSIMDPWDGPAALAFSDGIKIGAYLDRNGLRPGRYIITKSGKVVLASETGVLDIDPADVREKGKLAPGKMFLVDTDKQRIIRDNEIKSTVSRWKPYRRWLEENKIELKGLFQVPGQIKKDKDTLLVQQKAFGYNLEDFKTIIVPMVTNSQEPVGSMGNDAALAVLSERPQLIYNYFKQTFAQVTNPPIDPYRENLVMSLSSFVGRNKNLLEETPEHCRQLKLSQPTLTNEDIDRLKHSELEGFKVCSIPMLFEPLKGALEKGLIKLCLEAEKKVDDGYSMIILSDRDITVENAAIPALLAVSRVHQHLLRRNKRGLTALIIETGEAREVHHFAILLSFGASGVNPYLVFESLPDLQDRGYISRILTLPTAIMNYLTAVNKGLLKVMSKMGISTLRGYRHAQTFEAIGLDEKFVDVFFPGTVSRIGGVGLSVFEEETIHRHFKAFSLAENADIEVNSGGNYAYRQKEELHLFSPEVIVKLQEAVRGDGDYEKFKSYSQEVNQLSKNLCTLRGLFTFKKRKSIPLDEVESAESIVKRFVTSAMSLGSISEEAHQTLAIAMNRIGAKSNSGEGGEDEKRYQSLPNDDSAKSKVKQVASARFGVTSNYLVNSEEIQIKMAQGAKPGEGGQLPGFKVSDMIARVRHSTPGVMLISPPPHHDIYSIEDLSQLIFDLKCANPEARISVKLVSEVGVGTIAAGVAKGKADMILISGGDGGTGASPLSSIKHTGSSWEIGLAETQQVLVMNKLRGRVRLQVDGQIKTGRDVVVGALLGAEEFGFGSTALVTLGCIMMRKCHLNSCPVGVATQDSELRKRFTGKPENVINFMFFIAQEVREYMAELGFRTFDEMVGQVNRLKVQEAISHYKAKGLDFSKILYQPSVKKDVETYCVQGQDHDLSSSLNDNIIAKCWEALESKKPVQVKMNIHNYNRATGATLSAHVSKKYNSEGLPQDTISVTFSGSAGQSFGAFLAPGITFKLEGDANDYLGKGLSGGKIIVCPPKASTFRPENNIISGNVNLFGATSGEAYINGQVGERFCVRNSGAIAVVEGVGDHGCEYMTGGRVIVLGKTGVNFAAGMSGGIAYVLDENQLFDTRCNLEMVDIEPVTAIDDIQFLTKYLHNHISYTHSRFARELLHDWEEILPYFVKVMPVDYRRALERIKQRKYVDPDVVGMTEEVYT